jgi:tRNA(Ile)-lysidine synthase
VSEFVGQIEKSIVANSLFQCGQPILVAVSGGVDSMVLLHVLHELASKAQWTLAVAHLNHRLRGRSSDADERLVRKKAKELNLRCFVEAADVRKLAVDDGISIEMAARRLRHNFLAGVACRQGIQTIALAHHADDQLELFFLRLLRGTGSEGLAGMKWSNPSPADSAVQVVRPLLGCLKANLRRFAREQEITFREDASNTARDMMRNRIRHELLPLLQRHYQPALMKTTRRLIDILQADSEFMVQQAAVWLQKRKPAFDSLAVALQRRILQLQLHQKGWASDFDLIEQLRKGSDLSWTLSPGLRVQRDLHGLVHLRKSSPVEFNPNQMLLSLNGPRGKQSFDGLDVRWEIGVGRSTSTAVQPKPGREFFDADKIGGVITLRHWQPGDRFQPIGMNASVKLQDLFTNQKIARHKRNQLAIAATAAGDLFWVEGLRMSERFKLDKCTVRTLKWIWQRD